MTSVKKNLIKIKRELQEKAENNKISKKQLMDAIKNNAGYAKRTRRRYLELMKTDQLIKPVEGENETYQLTEKLKKDEKTEIDYSKDRKNVTVTINRELIDKMDELGINKSKFVEKKAMEEFSKIKERIEQMASDVEEQEDIEFIKDIIIESAYMKGEKDEKRKQIYIDHFGTYNEYSCEAMRKQAFKIAEKLGLHEKPKGL